MQIVVSRPEKIRRFIPKAVIITQLVCLVLTGVQDIRLLSEMFCIQWQGNMQISWHQLSPLSDDFTVNYGWILADILHLNNLFWKFK